MITQQSEGYACHIWESNELHCAWRIHRKSYCLVDFFEAVLLSFHVFVCSYWQIGFLPIGQLISYSHDLAVIDIGVVTCIATYSIPVCMVDVSDFICSTCMHLHVAYFHIKYFAYMECVQFGGLICFSYIFVDVSVGCIFNGLGWKLYFFLHMYDNMWSSCYSWLCFGTYIHQCWI